MKFQINNRIKITNKSDHLLPKAFISKKEVNKSAEIKYINIKTGN